MSTEEILLSICIPTYNRADIVYECVKGCLKIDIPNIEIVVCDNCSTDDTQEKVKSFNDERVKYYRNDINIGYRNIHQVMRHATGKYCFILSDEDDIDLSSLGRVYRKLQKEPDKGIILTEFCVENERIKNYYNHGVEAITQIGLKVPGYISGLIFLRKAVESIEHRIDEESVYYQIFPHGYIGILIAGCYDAMIVKEHTIRTGGRFGKTDVVAQKVKAFGFHWEPSSRREQFMGKIEVLKQIELSEKDKAVVANDILDDYHYMMVFGYYNIIMKDLNAWEIPESRKELIEEDRSKTRKEWLNYSKETFIQLKDILAKEYLGKSYSRVVFSHISVIGSYLKVLVKKKMRTRMFK